MLETRGGRDLPHEELAAENSREFRFQHFERDVAFVLEVFGQIDRGHAAGAELTLDPVAIHERCIQSLDDISHGTIRSFRREARDCP